MELHDVEIKPTEAKEGVRIKLISGFTATSCTRIDDGALAVCGVFDALICTT